MGKKIQLPAGSPDGRLIVAIVGRPNVGKSTFFNRVYGKRKAIESDIAKTTRDRLYAQIEWCGKKFLAVDTAGLFEKDKNDTFQDVTRESVNAAISEADKIIFLVDVNSGIESYDREIAKTLHKSGKIILLAVNKADNQNREIVTRELLSLGFGQPNFISSISGRGVADFLDIVVADFASEASPQEKNNFINVAIVGRPNVGKSTLLNSLTGKNRAVVSDTAGTTRDSTDEIIDFENQKIKITDTAGIRRRGKIDRNIEKFSVIRATGAIKDSSVIILLIDAEEGLTNQDTHLAGLAKDEGKSMIIAVNKFDIWDNLDEEKQYEKMAKMLGSLQEGFSFLPYVPVVFISAKNSKNTKTLLKKIIEVYNERFVEIGKEDLITFLDLAKTSNQQLPPIIDFYQERANPPVFKLLCKNKKRFHFSHIRYLENLLRDKYPFVGTPIFIDLIPQIKKSGPSKK